LLITTLALGVLQFPAEAGTITVSIGCGPNGDISPKGTLTLPAHSDLDVTATPNPGYELYDWYVNGDPGGWSVNQVHFAFGDLDVSIYVLFSRITNNVHASAGSNGRIDPNDSNSPIGVAWGDAVTFTATPNPHYHVDAWTLEDNGVNRVVQTGGVSYTLRNVTNESWLAVSFAPDTYTVQASANAHGALTPTGAVAVVYGDDQLFTAAPNPGYDVVVWSLDGQPILTNLTTFTLYNAQADHTLQVTFSPLVLAIALSPTNTTVLSWPDAISEYSLQENTDLKTTGWTTITTTPENQNGRQEVILPRSSGRRFYRLTQP
jgi:hypothetical protein